MARIVFATDEPTGEPIWDNWAPQIDLRAALAGIRAMLTAVRSASRSVLRFLSIWYL